MRNGHLQMSISEQNLGAGIGGQVRRRRWSEAQKRQFVGEKGVIAFSGNGIIGNPVDKSKALGIPATAVHVA